MSNYSSSTTQKSMVWERALEFIEAKLGCDIVETWFRPVTLQKVNGKTISLFVPNKYFGDWLEKNYSEIIREAICSVHNSQDGSIDIMFTVNDQKLQSSRDRSNLDSDNLSNIKRIGTRQRLNPRYTFENFVVGTSNQFAHAASLAVAEAPGRAYNPLFIYGGVGLGKTHLLHSIGNLVIQKGHTHIAYVTTEQFTNEVINSIRFDKMGDLRRRYRNIDILLIDDIQFLAGKERTQEEFFYTFNALHEAQKQVILSSDQSPKKIPSIEERLRSRFEWGLIADLQQPDMETRVAILKKKSEDGGIPIDDGVIQFLATCLRSNIRELEGALTRLGAYSSLTGCDITIGMAKTTLEDLLGSKRKLITLEDIQEVVANRYHIKVAELRSKRRTKNLVLPRQIAMFLSRELTKSSFPEIGREFGGKDHATIIYACRQIEKDLETNDALKKVIESLKDEITTA